MPKVKISEYSATANSNTDVASINIDEGCAPSGINNAIRAVMGHLKDFQQGTYGDPFNGPMNGTLGATTASTANVTTLTTSSTVTHNGGTPNGVAFLNGSKVLTTGSALVFDGSNLGLGVTPSAWNSNFKAFQISTGGSLSAAVSQSSLVDLGGNFYQDSGGTERYIASSTANKYRQYAGAHSWYTAPSGTAGNAITFTQAMTLDASGNLLVGTTNTDPTFNRVNGAVLLSNGSVLSRSAGGSDFGSSSTSGVNISFYTDNGSSRVTAGNISSNGSTTTYGTASDHRMKTDVQPMVGAINKVLQLKPVTYKWKPEFAGTNENGQGFIAHELAEVVPDCVTGEKDAVDENGNPKYQGIDTSFLVATLTAAIQELKAEFDAYKASHP